MKFDVNEMMKWFQLEYPEHTQAMIESNHHYTNKDLNSYHIEGDVWTHTCMVVNAAKLLRYPDTIIMSALLHDLGKPYVREVNDEKEKCYFKNHEGVSFWKAIEIVKRLTDVRHKQEAVLKLVSLHSVIFDNYKDGKFSKDFYKKFRNDSEFLEQIKMQVISDSMGRFCLDLPDVRDSFDNMFDEDFYKKMEEVENESYHYQKSNVLTILIGLPRAGKSTWIAEHVTDEVIISRDDTLLDFAKSKYGVETYSEAFKSLSDEDQLKVDEIINKEFVKAVKEEKDIVIDMTNMSKKSRRRWLGNFKGEKRAVVFATDLQEIYRRNESDRINKGKFIPLYVFENMAKNFTYPQYDEFDKIEMIIQ